MRCPTSRQSLLMRSACAALVCLLAACDDLPDWLGDKDKTPLPGKRIAVLSDTTDIKPDPSMADISVILPDLKANDSWPQAGGGPAGMTGNLQLPGLTHHDSATIDDGNGWEQPLYPSPIVASGMVFAMDAKGFITAHNAMDIGKIVWTNKSFVEEDDPDLLGGGLAFDNGRIYATSGRGKVIALNASSGVEIWKHVLGIPLRAAPKIGGGKVYALSVDNQLFALDADKGTQLWSHRGINENAGYLAAISPAVSDSVVIAPYSSGEIHALDTASGQDLWNDTLLRPRQNVATNGFSDIGGNPIIDNDTVYAAGSSGFTAAISLLNGRRIWEQNISALNTPWVAGNFVYLLSNDNILACISAGDGRIKWNVQLPRFENEEKHKHPLVWRGPILANNQLLIAGRHGEMLAYSPKDGSKIALIEIPETITDTPVVANGRLYMLTQDAKLHVLY